MLVVEVWRICTWGSLHTVVSNEISTSNLVEMSVNKMSSYRAILDWCRENEWTDLPSPLGGSTWGSFQRAGGGGTCRSPRRSDRAPATMSTILDCCQIFMISRPTSPIALPGAQVQKDEDRCRANLEQISQPRPDSGLDLNNFQRFFLLQNH